jgi:hypothetical protein
LLIKRRSFFKGDKFMHSKRRLMILATALGCLLLLPVMANAGYVSVGDSLYITASTVGAYDGAFNVDDLTNSAVADFKTFCVQTNEYVNLPGTYIVGGIGTNILTENTNVIGDETLKSQTAWLYSQFLSVPGYADTKEEQNALQAAIWHYQSIGGISGSASSYSLYYINASGGTTTVGGVSDNTKALYDTFISTASIHNTGDYGVAVMNLKYTSGANAQDMLVAVPLPGAVLLLGAGMARLVAYARRRKED